MLVIASTMTPHSVLPNFARVTQPFQDDNTNRTAPFTLSSIAIQPSTNLCRPNQPTSLTPFNMLPIVTKLRLASLPGKSPPACSDWAAPLLSSVTMSTLRVSCCLGGENQKQCSTASVSKPPHPTTPSSCLNLATSLSRPVCLRAFASPTKLPPSLPRNLDQSQCTMNVQQQEKHAQLVQIQHKQEHSHLNNGPRVNKANNTLFSLSCLG